MQNHSELDQKILEHLRLKGEQTDENGRLIEEEELIRIFKTKNLYNDKLLHDLERAAQRGTPSAGILSLKSRIPESTVRRILVSIKGGWMHNEDSIRIIQRNFTRKKNTGQLLNIDSLTDKQFERFIILSRICSDQLQSIGNQTPADTAKSMMAPEQRTKPEQSAAGLTTALLSTRFVDVVDFFRNEHPSMQEQTDPVVERRKIERSELEHSCLACIQLAIALHDFLTPQEMKEFLAQKWSNIYSEKKNQAQNRN